jgi:hypothetical protein
VIGGPDESKVWHADSITVTRPGSVEAEFPGKSGVHGTARSANHGDIAECRPARVLPVREYCDTEKVHEGVKWLHEHVSSAA